MKLRRVFRVLTLCSWILLMNSCSVEKINLSPTTKVVSNANKTLSPEYLSKEFDHQSKFTIYSSEITNSFKEIENLSNKQVNTEVNHLKFHISEFLYATQAHNMVGKEKALYNYEKSYKKVQRLKNKISDDEQELINRFLVKIKTNISLIETLKR